jgi:lipopolysaccharide cholinephosphotransferase
MVKLRIQLPDDFLKEEIRCGYTVTKEMKELWAVELDLLVEFDRVCRKHGIPYMADGGTVLGAVRHKGFIPWDDDIDLSMARGDYNRLCEIAPKEFIYPYFFQTEFTDPGSCRGHAQLRNSMTTCILESEMKCHFSFNQGVFIDIFPRDNLPDVLKERAVFFNKLMRLQTKSTRYRNYFFKVYNPHFIKKSLQKVLRVWFLFRFGRKYNNIYYKRLEQMKQKYDLLPTRHVANLFSCPIMARVIWESMIFEKSQMLPFEYISIPVPLNCNDYLVNTYGDWKTFIRGKSCHGSSVFDVNTSYTSYVSFDSKR